MAAVYARAHSAAEARQEALKLRDRALQRQVRARRMALGSASHSRCDLGAAADAALSRGLTFPPCAPPGGRVAAGTGSASRVGRQHRLRSGGSVVGVFVRRRYFATLPCCTPGTTCRTLLTGSGFVSPLPPLAFWWDCLTCVRVRTLHAKAKGAPTDRPASRSHIPLTSPHPCWIRRKSPGWLAQVEPVLTQLRFAHRHALTQCGAKQATTLQRRTMTTPWIFSREMVGPTSSHPRCGLMHSKRAPKRPVCLKTGAFRPSRYIRPTAPTATGSECVCKVTARALQCWKFQGATLRIRGCMTCPAFPRGPRI